ncbi:MAG: hypothetical protein ACKVH8_13520 [Pirellulales bacterium]
MAHEKAKLLLETSNDYIEHIAAVQTALQMGMPMEEIEEYLDWLDLITTCEPAE